MPDELGLTPIQCSACAHRFLVSVARLKTAVSIPCSSCGVEILVTELENRDPTLARVLAVLREQDRLKR